jgi:hypothetical protein
LEILRKVQITYQLPNGRELVPVLCDENSSGSAQPEWFENETMQHTSYEFQYEYLPDTIVHRLMIFCYQSHYYVRFRWRKGMRVDFTSDDSARLTAVIDTGNESRSVMIDIYSDGHIPCWQFLSKLREEILQINTDLNLTAKDYINMETDGVKDRFSVEKVLRSRSRGWDIIQADHYDGDYKVSDILGSAYGHDKSVFIENMAVSQKGAIDNDSINRILSTLDQLEKAVGNIDERSKYMLYLQYLVKDQMDERFIEVLQSQEILTSLIRTLNEKPSEIKKLGGKILHGAAVTADLVTLVEAANPGSSMMICSKVAETIQMILQHLG